MPLHQPCLSLPNVCDKPRSSKRNDPKQTSITKHLLSQTQISSCGASILRPPQGWQIFPTQPSSPKSKKTRKFDPVCNSPSLGSTPAPSAPAHRVPVSAHHTAPARRKADKTKKRRILTIVQIMVMEIVLVVYMNIDNSNKSSRIKIASFESLWSGVVSCLERLHLRVQVELLEIDRQPERQSSARRRPKITAQPRPFPATLCR